SWMPRQELLGKMNSCDVFFFTSLRDGGGNVVVEAMAVGKPIVCLDLAGPGFHVDSSCGIKVKAEVPNKTIEDIASALEKLYFDANLRSKLGEGARIKAKNNYSRDVLGDKLKNIFNEVIRNSEK
ncbi:MAG: glycosyltransferase, partial [Candidatus Staskawiczbacteria bacterium]